MIPTEGISKSLRDDYAAFSLAAISYSMLHTTALALGNKRVASVAEQYLTDYAGAIERINEIMPSVVNRELAKDGDQTDPSAVAATNAMVSKAWSSATTATAGHGAPPRSASSQPGESPERRDPVHSAPLIHATDALFADGRYARHDNDRGCGPRLSL